MRYIRNISTFLIIATVTFVTTPFALAQKGRTLNSGKTILAESDLSPEPIFLSGNPNCTTLNADNALFPHIVEDYELKLDFQSPNGQFFFTGGQPGVVLNGPAAATRSVSVSTTGNTFNWSSNMQITAVIVKGGPNANVYSYNPGSFGGNPDGFGLTTPRNGRFGVSHVSFCFGVSLVPSAATASVSGQVIDGEGQAVRGAMIEVWNLTRNEYSYGQSNNFGRYTISELLVGDLYFVTARHGRYTFQDNGRSFTLLDAVSDVDFFALP